MIVRSTLKILAVRRVDDARILLQNRKYFTSIYLAGYSLEMALKFGICRIMKFNKGFPENKSEFTAYYSNVKNTLLRTTIKELRDIRHHKLPILLRYSGEEINIADNFLMEWDAVKNWGPEMRYQNIVVRKPKAQEFLKSTKAIINAIL